MQRLRTVPVFSADSGGFSGDEKRLFNRRRTALSGHISEQADFQTSWSVQVADISLAGMRLIGNLPELQEKTIYMKLGSQDEVIECSLVGQDADGVRVAVDIQRLDIERLIAQHDIFASLVLETISDDK